MKIFLIILGIYLLYKFIVDFAIPIYTTSKRMQEQFRTMNQSRNADQAPFNGTAAKKPEPQPKSSSRDYIEFEEIKD